MDRVIDTENCQTMLQALITRTPIHVLDRSLTIALTGKKETEQVWVKKS